MQAEFPLDHAGKSLMMALCPEGVDMKRFSAEQWYAQGTREDSPEPGEKLTLPLLDYLRTILRKKY